MSCVSCPEMVNIVSCHHTDAVCRGSVEKNSRAFKPRPGITTKQIAIAQINILRFRVLIYKTGH